MAKKFYYTIIGDNGGQIYTNWEDTKKALPLKLFGPNQRFKGFVTLAEAEMYRDHGINEYGIYIKSLLDDNVLYAYTDGTTHQNKRVGSGVVIVNKLQVLKEFSSEVKQADYLGAYQIGGELNAALIALTHYENLNTKQPLALVYDYLGVGSFVNGGKCNTPMTQQYKQDMLEIIRRLKTQGKTVKFIKIPSHSNIKFNERADELARKAIGLT